MNTQHWGPPLWIALHAITFNAPKIISPEDQYKYIELFENLTKTLPCKYCRQSYVFFYNHLPIEEYLTDRMGLTYWLYTMHTLVNLKLGKKDMPTFSEVVCKYEKMRATSEIDYMNQHIIDDFIKNAIEKYSHKSYKYCTIIVNKLDAIDWDFNKV